MHGLSRSHRVTREGEAVRFFPGLLSVQPDERKCESIIFLQAQ
jgi:hypothetical protein